MYDLEDDRGVPVSAGIPPIVVYAGIAGVVLIFIVAGMVLGSASANHVWPADAATNLKL